MADIDLFQFISDVEGGFLVVHRKPTFVELFGLPKQGTMEPVDCDTFDWITMFQPKNEAPPLHTSHLMWDKNIINIGQT